MLVLYQTPAFRAIPYFFFSGVYPFFLRHPEWNGRLARCPAQGVVYVLDNALHPLSMLVRRTSSLEKRVNSSRPCAGAHLRFSPMRLEIWKGEAVYCTDAPCINQAMATSFAPLSPLSAFRRVHAPTRQTSPSRPRPTRRKAPHLRSGKVYRRRLHRIKLLSLWQPAHVIIEKCVSDFSSLFKRF